MYEPRNFTQTIFRVVNITTNLICSDFSEDEENELNAYLKLCQNNYPDCEYAVYKIFKTIKESRIK